MEFKKYQHIERYGNTEVKDIEIGECLIFPKLDGTNSQVFLDNNGNLKAGSRNRELTLEKDNAGFYAWALEQDNIKQYLQKHQYYKRQIDKKKLNKLHNITWWAVWNKGEYKKRCYLSRRRKWAKKRTNTKIRNYKDYIGNGGEYRKHHEYWWEIW